MCNGFIGQVCPSTEGNGKTTTYAYDGDGNLVTVTPPAPQGITTYGLDTLGRVTSVTDGNGDVTANVYNIRDQIVKTTFDGGATVVVSYYPNALEQKQTDSVAGIKTQTYDVLGNLTGESGPTTASESYSYDPAGNLARYTEAGLIKYVYDAANQLTQSIEPDAAWSAFSAMWEAVKTYPLHRTASVASNLGLNALAVINKTLGLPRNHVDVIGVSDEDLEAKMNESADAQSAEPEWDDSAFHDLVKVLSWAAETGTLTRDEISILARADLGEDEDRNALADELGSSRAQQARLAYPDETRPCTSTCRSTAAGSNPALHSPESQRATDAPLGGRCPDPITLNPPVGR